jgi:hypothetical protein
MRRETKWDKYTNMKSLTLRKIFIHIVEQAVEKNEAHEKISKDYLSLKYEPQVWGEKQNEINIPTWSHLFIFFIRIPTWSH